MTYPAHLLLSDEECILDTRPHWWTLVAPTFFVSGTAIAVIVAAAVVGGSMKKAVLGILLIVLLASLLNLGFCYLRWTNTNFVVTDQRIIYRAGIIGKHAKEMPLDRITNIAFNQTVFERVIGSGDLTIESAGETSHETFHYVRRPSVVQAELYRQMEGLQDRDFQRQAGMMGQATASNMTNSVPDQISKLDELRQKGLLSDVEFEQKKRELLERM